MVDLQGEKTFYRKNNSINGENNIAKLKTIGKINKKAENRA